MDKKYHIEIAFDTPEIEQFRDYLLNQGHQATIGDTTWDCIDGSWTSHDLDANEIMRKLWGDYCAS